LLDPPRYFFRINWGVEKLTGGSTPTPPTIQSLIVTPIN